MAKKVLFIDRDGTIIKEAPPTYQIDSFDKLEFYAGMFTWLSRIANELDYELVMPTNQDGLGTSSFPEESFLPVHNFILKQLRTQGINFSEVLIDKTFAKENAPTRKPGVAMFTKYLNSSEYDLGNSFVTGDRSTDVQLAKMKNSRNIYEQLCQKGIIVRDRSKVVLCEDSLRITIGTEEENKKLIEALNNL